MGTTRHPWLWCLHDFQIPPPPLVLFSFVLPTYIDFSQLLLEEVQKPLGPGLSNTADRLKKLNKSKEEDQVFSWRKNHRIIWWKKSSDHLMDKIIGPFVGKRVIGSFVTLFEETIILQARLWEWRDTVEAIWEDPAIKVDWNVAEKWEPSQQYYGDHRLWG